jgi:hypothetical protein
MRRRLAGAVGVFALVVLLASALPRGADVLQDLVALAQQALWFNDRGETLPFPGTDSDSRGFVRVLTTRLEDGRSYENVLETHPRWAANGSIAGRYRLTIPANSAFEAKVGFMEGAAGTDGVTFSVGWRQGPITAPSPTGELQLARVRKTLDGRLQTISADLTRFAGQEGNLFLRVNAGTSSDRDWAVWVQPAITQRTRPSGPGVPVLDRDQDGIPDDKERELLDKYRPELLYARGENYRPCDAIWYVRHSELKPGADEGASNVISRDVLRADPSRLLTANKSGSHLGPSDITRNPRRTGYCLNPFNKYRDGYEPGDGYDWPDIFRLGNVGVYGHVVPWRNYYEISYWLFYGYNNSEAWMDIADHEGDWESVHLLIDPATGWLVKGFHCAHGSEMAFDFSVQGISRVMVNTAVGSVVEFRGPNYDTSNFNMRTNTDRACNNLVRFHRDPDTGDYTHVMVYVERNTHGSWPSEHWTYKVRVAGRDYSAPPHPGNANMFLSKNPPNLGEVEHPLSDDARIILRYNGRWGAYRGHAADAAGTDTPPGPQFHWQWVWPRESHLSGLRKNIPEASFTDGSSFFHGNPY